MCQIPIRLCRDSIGWVQRLSIDYQAFLCPVHFAAAETAFPQLQEDRALTECHPRHFVTGSARHIRNLAHCNLLQEYTGKLASVQAKGDDYEIAAAQIGVEVYSAMSSAVGA